MKVGDRIELMSMPDDPAPIEPGARGTITGITDTSGLTGGRRSEQVSVKWNNGRTLHLVRPPDQFRVVRD